MALSTGRVSVVGARMSLASQGDYLEGNHARVFTGIFVKNK